LGIWPGRVIEMCAGERRGKCETQTEVCATTGKAEMTLGSAGLTARATVLFGVLVSLLLAPQALEAKEDPVQWTLGAVNNTTNIKPGGHVWLELTASIQPEWHLYSPTTPPGGPIITTIRLAENPALESFAVYRPKPVRKLDPNFQLETETYTAKAVFLIVATLKPSAKGMTTLEAAVRYQACTEVKCLPAVKKSVSAVITVDPSGTSMTMSPPVDSAPVASAAASAPASASVSPNASVLPPASSSTPSGPIRFGTGPAQGLLPFLLTAFGFGLASLFTPCVFPMIPITVSFFLNQQPSGDGPRSRGWVQALVFCLGIVVLFTGLGFLVTLVSGPFGVVQLGSSPWVNGFISLVFFVFGLSLLGAFELTLPSGLLTRLDRASQGGGTAGTLLMGLTFSLTSFACIGPIVGPLLVASVQSKGLQPVLGMASFATGLAAPFFLLALFPSYLGRLPRSGAWMSRIKVCLGFLVLAAMLKYLANVDAVLGWHFLTRERVLAGWIVLFALPGIYLLGWLRMEGMSKDEPVTVLRALIAALLLIFSISLIPGLFGARLGELDAFLPESSGSLFGAVSGASPARAAFKNDLEGAVKAARADGKLVLVNFTGYACTNCHWMKANMFTRPEIQAALQNIVVVDLYTDGTDAESEKNQRFEDSRFATVSIPFYALMDTDDRVIATFPQLTRNPREFLAFLESKPKSGA
jgi:thiol:disulfide interchange protein